VRGARIGSSRTRWIISPVGLSQLAILALFALLAGTLLSAKGLVIAITVHDAYVVMDATWRMALGEIAHQDFHSPIGQAFFWPLALLTRLGDVSAATIVHASILVGLVLLALGWIALPGRLSPFAMFAMMALVLTTALTPRDIGWGPTVILSNLAPYNRWGWSFLLLAVSIALVPRRQPAALTDGLILGICCSVLLYLKISYGLAAAGLMMVGVLGRATRPRTLLTVVVVVLAVAALVEVVAHNNAQYLADLAAAGRANTGRMVDLSKLQRHLAEGFVYWLLDCALLWCLQPTRSPIAFVRTWAYPLLATAVLTVGGALLVMQNHPFWECPLFLGGGILTWELGRRQTGRIVIPPERLVPLVAVVIIGAYPLVLDFTAIRLEARRSQNGWACRMEALAGGFGDNLMLSARAFPGGERGRGVVQPCATADDDMTVTTWRDGRRLEFEAARLQEALTVLHRIAGPHDRILALEFGNPYPAFTGTVPPSGSLLWWDAGRSFSAAVHPDPDRLLGSTTIVLQERWAGSERPDGIAVLLWRIYGPQIERRYVRVALTQYWTVWKRRPT
jgi:hypothetical protein